MSARTLEFYSGIGGLHVALQRSSVPGVIVRAFDWDQSACQVYETFHGKGIVHKTDISTLSASDLAAFDASLWLLSPSCQPYTILNPSAKGAADPRARSFIHLIESVLPELVQLGKQPSHLLVENVAGFETSSTRKNLLNTLDTFGYTCIELLLTPLQYGIPNSRLRYYLLAKLKTLPFAHIEVPGQRVWRRIPGGGDDWVDPRQESDLDRATEIFPLRNFLDDELSAQEGQNYVIPPRVLEKWGRLFDIVLPSQRRSCCFTRGYTKLVERAGSILQMNEELDTTTVFDTFLQAQSLGNPDALDILRPLQLRYFSPSELLRIFGFNPPHPTHPPDSDTTSHITTTATTFRWPEKVTIKTQYKLIGNSVNVCVVTRLIDFLFAE